MSSLRPRDAVDTHRDQIRRTRRLETTRHGKTPTYAARRTHDGITEHICYPTTVPVFATGRLCEYLRACENLEVDKEIHRQLRMLRERVEAMRSIKSYGRFAMGFGANNAWQIDDQRDPVFGSFSIGHGYGPRQPSYTRYLQHGNWVHPFVQPGRPPVMGMFRISQAQNRHGTTTSAFGWDITGGGIFWAALDDGEIPSLVPKAAGFYDMPEDSYLIARRNGGVEAMGTGRGPSTFYEPQNVPPYAYVPVHVVDHQRISLLDQVPAHLALNVGPPASGGFSDYSQPDLLYAYDTIDGTYTPANSYTEDRTQTEQAFFVSFPCDWIRSPGPPRPFGYDISSLIAVEGSVGSNEFFRHVPDAFAQGTYEDEWTLDQSTFDEVSERWPAELADGDLALLAAWYEEQLAGYVAGREYEHRWEYLGFQWVFGIKRHGVAHLRGFGYGSAMGSLPDVSWTHDIGSGQIAFPTTTFNGQRDVILISRDTGFAVYSATGSPGNSSYHRLDGISYVPVGP